MTLTGLIKDKSGTLPGANIFVSDANGKALTPLRGDSSDVITGGYILENVKPEDYVTVSYVGYKKNTKKVADLGTSGNTIRYDFILQPDTAELQEFEIVEYQTQPNPTITKKDNSWLMYSGIGLLAIIVGGITYKAL